MNYNQDDHILLPIQVALTLHGFTLHDPHFTRGLLRPQGLRGPLDSALMNE